jgi:hypothetical protein
MRFFKLAVISVIVIFVILTAMSSLLPSQILVSRAVDIKGSSSQIRENLFQLKNWQKWMTDAQGNKTQHYYGAYSNVVIIGTTTITVTSKTDSTLVTEWSSSKTMKGTFRIINHHRPDSLITVQWQMEQDVKWYPWEKFASITKDELWGGSMEKSLENLKLLVESR